MQPVNKALLIEKLLDLMRGHADSPTQGSDDQLRQQIGLAIDMALITTPELDTRRVTILLSDLRGFTAVAEHYTALEMVEALNRYFNRMTEIIIGYGGTIDKFMGDAIMALFGAPVARQDDVEAALACAIEMQMAMKDINLENQTFGMAPLYMGIGINTGEVVAGHLGSVLHSEYTVIGDQVNLASRVEAHSLRGQILLSENTYLLACDFIETGQVNEVRVKGKKGMVRMLELLSTRRPRHLVAPAREIRNSPRVEVDIAVKFQRVSGKSVLPEELIGRVVDISYGGMYIVSPVALAAFSDIKIALSTSLGSDLTEIYAKVLRVSAVNNGFECRIEFTSIHTVAALTIKEFVDGIVEINRLS
ncbi:MAG: PilZ domain-containing protein [Rhodoferax sp.]|jgi:adenylate cyclase|nr:PilZ domain-containing protein [Rhodoferax sp.]